ncbi:hypothetical protein LY90DRAFT_371646, partial [Neocallimastix californiae]
KCWALAEGYNCCSPGTPVSITDSKGKWGIENEEWCGIIDTTPSNGSCWAEAEGFRCCKGCEAIYIDGDKRWGVENMEWCGI